MISGLPELFGKAYPRVLYGLEGIQGWSRIGAVIPESFGKAIEETKAQMDFWINIAFGGLVLAVGYGVLAILCGIVPQWWIPVVATAVSWAALAAARAMAVEWGMLVTSGFDVCRADLCEKLGLSMPGSIEDERKMWTAYSQAMVFRSEPAANLLTEFRARSQPDKDNPST